MLEVVHLTPEHIADRCCPPKEKYFFLGPSYDLPLTYFLYVFNNQELQLRGFMWKMEIFTEVILQILNEL